MTQISSCNQVVDTLSDYLDGEFSLLDRIRLRFHLWRCPTCVDYFKQFKRIYEETGSVERSDLPEDFDRVMKQVLDRWLEKPPE